MSFDNFMGVILQKFRANDLDRYVLLGLDLKKGISKKESDEFETLIKIPDDLLLDLNGHKILIGLSFLSPFAYLTHITLAVKDTKLLGFFEPRMPFGFS